MNRMKVQSNGLYLTNYSFYQNQSPRHFWSNLVGQKKMKRLQFFLARCQADGQHLHLRSEFQRK